MQVTIDEEKLRLMTEALVQADDLVSSVIRGEATPREALSVARTLNELKRNHGFLRSAVPTQR